MEDAGAAFSAAQPRASRHLARAMAGRRLHHAWLLVGGDEGGARAFAAELQAALLCNDRALELLPPCGRCPSCRARRGDHHPDAVLLQPGERGHIAIEQVRAVTASLALSRQAADRRVVWVWAADRLVPAAQNALLKSLEEPPAGTLFLLSAQRPGALLATVRSRCLALQLADAGAAAAEAGAGPEPEREPDVRGPDVDGAGAAIAAGLSELARPAADLTARWPTILARANEWGRDPAQAAQACLAIEARVRDALAWHLGAGPGDPSWPTLAQACECAELIAWGRARNTLAQQRPWHLLRLLATLFGPPGAPSWREPRAL